MKLNWNLVLNNSQDSIVSVASVANPLFDGSEGQYTMEEIQNINRTKDSMEAPVLTSDPFENMRIVTEFKKQILKKCQTQV